MVRTDNDKISLYQMFVLYVGATIGVNLVAIPRVLASYGTTNGWIAIILMSLITMLFAFIIYYINIKTEKDSFFETCSSLVGNVFAYIILTIFTVYTIIAAAIELRDFAMISKELLLENTPIEVVIIVALVVAGLIILGGIEPLARFIEVIFVVACISMLLLFIIVFRGIKLDNFLPVMYIKPMSFLKMCMSMTFMLGGFELLLVIMPNVKSKHRGKKHIFFGAIIVMAFCLLMNFMTIGRYGAEYTKMLVWPGMTLMRDIYVNEAFIENPVIISMILWIVTGISTMAIYLFASYSMVNQMVSRVKEVKKPIFIVVPILAAAYYLSMLSENFYQTIKYKQLFSMYVMPITMFLIPIVLLIAVKLKKRK
jgi:spore germination protein